MKLTKCENGHFYDSDKYPECPYCNTDLLRDRSIVRTGEAEQPAAVETAAPAGPVTGWLVVLDGPAKGRDLRRICYTRFVRPLEEISWLRS